MQLQIFAVKDIKAGLFGPPMVKTTHAVMERDWKKIANDNQHPIGQYPGDHDLYFLGTYNDETATMDLFPTPKHVSNGASQTEIKPN